jgi:hypothetical protein
MRNKMRSTTLLGQILFLIILGLLILAQDYSKNQGNNQKYKHMRLIDRPYVSNTTN